VTHQTSLNLTRYVRVPRLVVASTGDMLYHGTGSSRARPVRPCHRGIDGREGNRAAKGLHSSPLTPPHGQPSVVVTCDKIKVQIVAKQK